MTFEYKTPHQKYESTLINWLETHAFLPADSVRMLNEIGTRPPVPYGTIQLLVDGILEGQDSQHFQHNTSTNRIDVATNGPRRMTAQVAIYTSSGREDVEGRSARIKLAGAIAALRSPSVHEIFAESGLAFMQQLSAPRAFDDQLGDRWERRMQVDLEFGYTSVYVDKSTGVPPNSVGGLSWIETNVAPIITVKEHGK